jgi:hypothetical protein
VLNHAYESRRASDAAKMMARDHGRGPAPQRLRRLDMSPAGCNMIPKARGQTGMVG